jgi:hypothetical protein
VVPRRWADRGDETVGPENVALRQYLYFCTSKANTFVLGTASTFVLGAMQLDLESWGRK